MGRLMLFRFVIFGLFFVIWILVSWFNLKCINKVILNLNVLINWFNLKCICIKKVNFLIIDYIKWKYVLFKKWFIWINYKIKFIIVSLW